MGGLLMGCTEAEYAIVFPMVFLLKRRWQELAGMALTGVVWPWCLSSWLGWMGLSDI